MKVLDSISDERLHALLFPDLFLLRRRSDEDKRRFRREWMNEFLYTDYMLPGRYSGRFLFFRSLCRQDYKELFSDVINASSVNDYLVVEDFSYKSERLNVAASRFASDNFSVIKRLQIENPLDRECCAIRLIKYAYIVELLRKYDFDILVCFADMQPVEYLATVFFDGIGKDTITLQHGLYIDYGQMDTVNVINYKNQSAKYFLSWGRDTASLIKKYNPNTNVVVCGNPKLRSVIGHLKNIRNRLNSVLVVLDQEVFQKSNCRMLEIVYWFASKEKISVRLRFHPHNNKAFYRKMFPALVEHDGVEHFDLVVGHTSSLLFEMEAIGHQVVQFKSEIPTINLPELVQFQDNAGFSRAVSFASAPENREGVCSNVISMIGEESRLKYKDFFSGLLVNSPLPLISIIVPCYNSASHIERCISSIKAQVFDNYEIVFVDGASKDLTLKLLSTYAVLDDRIRVHSSPDSGIYDAMNKGVRLAKGKWLYFMGSDDCFYDQTVLSRISDYIDNTDAAMVYGSVQVVGDVKWAKNGSVYDGVFDDVKIQRKNICHQAIFYRGNVLRDVGGYNINYRVCADWDLNLKIWAKHKTFYADMVVAKFIAGGASTAGTDPAFGKDFVENKKLYFGLERFVK
ncbi:MAG: glycosyltransferase family 2 protein [Rhodocyclaceae bacterium]|nr:glycosyltransferase family 2 protein [Rhodocyclaceae bacterium]